MSYSEFNDFLKSYGTPRTNVEGGEIVLTKSDAIRALALLAGTDILILGGDVYELENDNYFRPTYDNWYFNQDDSVSSRLAEESRAKALAYLNNYKEAEGLSIRYVLVVDA